MTHCIHRGKVIFVPLSIFVTVLLDVIICSANSMGCYAVLMLEHAVISCPLRVNTLSDSHNSELLLEGWWAGKWLGAAKYTLQLPSLLQLPCGCLLPYGTPVASCLPQSSPAAAWLPAFSIRHITWLCQFGAVEFRRIEHLMWEGWEH